jgi:hypothetical protein
MSTRWFEFPGNRTPSEFVGLNFSPKAAPESVGLNFAGERCHDLPRNRQWGLNQVASDRLRDMRT